MTPERRAHIARMTDCDCRWVYECNPRRNGCRNRGRWMGDFWDPDPPRPHDATVEIE